ncbi:TrmB family transcriptional regulator [Halogeometricum sp. S1BR25-6]|uniref:TrmB family transcriptional regulator n=1 Tax=Halogeometricum salsisoli TaxID=2950536 RepID=A0ABU2GA58_9EURY|nr:helix-turn-helix domain-containing protein [Halogeometricum sp. S1BR25-6]MDS0297184.1 TrmB family transcriptional regulator [Halogeometricum sp. S1BR25-6]
MEDLTNVERAVELLQKLGLKEYEAKCFVALTQLPSGTAKHISEISEVPRTRVYDAVRVLETQGLVEIQHANPQRFRAVSIDEAAQTLRSEYESRTESLRETLQGVEAATVDDEVDVSHEVWALSGSAAIATRTTQLVDEAESEVVLIVGHESALTDDLVERLESAQDRGVSVVVGTVSESLHEDVRAVLPGAEAFVSELEWLRSTAADDATEITRLLLVDRTTILVSTTHSGGATGEQSEQAVFGRGFENGLVTIVRRLMSTGLFPVDDPYADPAADGGSSDAS